MSLPFDPSAHFGHILETYDAALDAAITVAARRPGPQHELHALHRLRAGLREAAQGHLARAAPVTQPRRRGPAKRKRCPACGRLSRVTTAGCDHCDFEDK